MKNNKNYFYGASLSALAFFWNILPAQADTCVIPPTCSALGYTKATSDCNGQEYLRCPFEINNDNAVYCFTTTSPDSPINSPCVDYLKNKFPYAIFVKNEAELRNNCNTEIILLNDISVLSSNNIGNTTCKIYNQYAFNQENSSCLNNSAIYNVSLLPFAPQDITVKLVGNYILASRTSFLKGSSGSDVTTPSCRYASNNFTIARGVKIKRVLLTGGSSCSENYNISGDIQLYHISDGGNQILSSIVLDGILDYQYDANNIITNSAINLNITTNGSAKIKIINYASDLREQPYLSSFKMVYGGCLNGFTTSRPGGVSIQKITAAELEDVTKITDDKGLPFDVPCKH